MPAPSLDEMNRLLRGTGAFDEAYYLSANPDVAAAGLDPLRHYLTVGHRQGRRPAPLFDPAAYLAANPDVAEAGVEPFFHFVFQGFREGRPIRAERGPAPPPPEAEPPPAAHFDATFYRDANPDVVAAGFDPAWHYAAFGEAEGRRPNPFFDPQAYARLHPDVARAGIGLFEHFSRIGWREGRSLADGGGRKPFKRDRHILFIGHDAIRAGAQTMLLETVRWFSDHTDFNVTVLLCDVGPLVGAFAELADVVVLHNYVFDRTRLAHLFAVRWDLVYANTVRSGAITRQVMESLHAPAPLVAHLHELETVLKSFPDEFCDLIATADRFIVVNDAIADHLEQLHGIPRSGITVEHPFIRALLRDARDLEGCSSIRQEARRALGVSDDTVLVIGCGTAYERKGIDIFVETGLACLAEARDVRLRFAWIGGGAGLADAEQRVRAAGAETFFIFPGQRDDANRLIGGADLFFLSSREDPFPLVCLEAAQYGVPTVHFDRGTGIGDFVRAEDFRRAAGVAVPAFSAQAAAGAILRLARDAARRMAFGSNARGRLFATFEAGSKLVRLFQILVEAGLLKPAVSVVVPNYNHAPYLDARLRSVLDQTLRSLEIVILDDCSRDDSVGVIEKYLADPRVSFHPNAANSGSPFAQWAKGVALARAEIVWIAESDDLAEPDFCRALIGAFADPLVTIATGRTEIISPAGDIVPGALDAWYDGAEIDLFKQAWTRDGIAFIRSHYGARSTLVNASAMLLRRASLVPALEGAAAYRVCGDWLVYLRMLKHGKLAFSDAARSFFRRHPQSTVHSVEGTPTYFRERAAIANWVTENAALTATEIRRILAELQSEWDRFAYKNPGGSLGDFVDAPALLRRARRRRGTIGLYVHGLLFSKGGIERLAAELANALVVAGFGVVAYCAARGSKAQPVYPLLGSVRVIGIALEAPDAVDRLADQLRRDGVEVFVPMLSENLFEPAVAAGVKAGVRILASEHNDPWMIENLWWSPEARARCFARADRIHLLLPAYVASLPEELRDRAVVIPNGIALGGAHPLASCSATRIVCVARLAPQKRLDLLVEAFALLAALRPDWVLTIVGAGTEEVMLREQIEALGLSGRVLLPGTTDHVAEILADSSIFVLPSAFEGFPLVLLEAQRAGLPCVAFRACTGAAALISDDVDGLLVDPFGAASLAEALLRLVDDEALRRRLGRAGRAAVAAHGLDRTVARWIETLDELLAEV